MGNRKLPFGYRLQDGQMQIAEAEAEVVRMIFSSYAEGSSYKTLADLLNNGALPYSPGKLWNKNAVARILQDTRYWGDDSFPPIFTSDTYKERTPCFTGKLEDSRMKGIRILARCAVCGNAVRRERKDTWRCPRCISPAAAITDQRLADCVEYLLRGVHEHPDMMSPSPTTETENERILDVNKRFKNEMECAEFHEDAAKAMALSLAAVCFDSLGSEDYETMRIQNILSKVGPCESLDTVLLRQITSAILIHPSGAVSMKLKNGQIIERSDLSS